MLVEQIAQIMAIVVPLALAALWLVVSAVLGATSGWFRLAAKYPDQEAETILRLTGQSGKMGAGLHMSGILILGVCRAGLRVGMSRIFGPFERDFFVPWEDITPVKKTSLLGSRIELRFGCPVVGTLTIYPDLARRIAEAAIGNWSEAVELLGEEQSGRRFGLLAQWLVLSAVGALFFTLVERVILPAGPDPPVLMPILFPTIFFGLVTLVKGFRGGN